MPNTTRHNSAGPVRSAKRKLAALVTAGGLVWGQVIPAFATIDNTVTATFTRSGQVFTTQSSENVDVANPVNGIFLDKSSVFNDGGNGRADPGDVISYTFLVENIGNTTLRDVNVTEFFSGTGLTPVISTPAAVTTDSGTVPLGQLAAAGQLNDSNDSGSNDSDWDALGPRDSITFTATYAITQDDIDAGNVTNNATAAGRTPANGAVSAADQTQVLFSGTSSVALTKSGVLNAGLNAPQADAGDTISYQFIVTNTGTTTLSNVSINDLLLANLPEDRFYATLDAVRDGVDATATAAISPVDRPLVIASPVPLPDIYAALAVERKLISISGEHLTPKVGDIVGVVFSVVNTGDAPLTRVSAEQQKATSFGDSIELLPRGQVDRTSLLFTYTLTDADVASGRISAFGKVTAQARDKTLEVLQLEALPLATLQAPEDVVTASISPVSFGPLLPGRSTTFTATYIVSQTNVNAGVVSNTATASARAPGGSTINSAPAQASVPLPAVPDIAMVKAASLNLGNDGLATIGDVITYTFTVSNPGNVSIQGTSIGISDPLPGLTPRVYISGDVTPIGTLDPGERWIYRATHGLTQVDLNALQVQNTAVVNGTSVAPSSAAVNDTSHPTNPALDGPTTVGLTPRPAISILKPVGVIADSNSSSQVDAGDIVTYTLTVTNPGNVSFTNVGIADILTYAAGPTLVSGDTAVPGSLDPGETWTYTASYVLTQQDVDLGRVNNSATVSGRAPNNQIYSDISDPNTTAGSAQTITPIPPQRRIALIKTSSVFDANLNSITDEGDRIDYIFDVRNLGNVTLQGVTISDPTIGPVNGSLATFAPGAIDTTTFTASYTITALDMAAGRVTNTATVNARTTQNVPVTDISDNSSFDENDATITPLISQPAIAVLKTVNAISDTNFNGVTDQGDKIIYSFAVWNTGNVTLSQVTLADTIADVDGGPIGTLLAGDTDTITFTAEYTLSASDIAAGFVENSATVSGIAPDTSVVDDLSDAESYAEDDPTRTYLASAPRIALVKEVSSIADTNNSGTQDEGDTIAYRFTVTNTGNKALTNVTVTDVNATVAGGPVPVLGIAQSDSTTFTAVHVISRDDLLANGVTNQAVASGQPPTGSRVTDLSDDASVLENDPTFTALSGVPGIAVVKTVKRIDDRNGNGITDVGDVINYGFAITNTGSVTLQNVTLTDPNAVISGPGLTQLTPGTTNSRAFTGLHVITIADAESGQVTNQATVRATSLSGAAVSDASDNASVTSNNPTITPVAQSKPVLTKTAARSEVRRGEKVNYTISASNLLTGPYTLVDTLPPGFSYVKNSAVLNGAGVVPSGNDAVLSFSGLNPDAQGRVTIKMTLLAGTSLTTGDFINRVSLFDEGNGVLLARAEALVRIKPEHVFDCGEIIGRVFDDRNGNGYADEGEPGLPGVRVVTVNGLLLTSDKNGRFHISCADIPDASIGSNFILKLDPRSLPEGYVLTTENPRDVRLTRGKVTKLNFGANRSCNVALDIKRDAFVGNSANLKPEWSKGLDRLTSVLQQCPGKLSIIYRCGKYAPIADTRLTATRDALLLKWEEIGRPYELHVSSHVECGK